MKYQKAIYAAMQSKLEIERTIVAEERETHTPQEATAIWHAKEIIRLLEGQ